MTTSHAEPLPVDVREQLLELLRTDAEVRALILDIVSEVKVSAPASLPEVQQEQEPKVIIQEVEKIVEVEKPVEVVVEKIVEVEKPVEVIVEKIVEKIIEVEKIDPLRTSLARELEVLAAVNRDADIQKLWLSGADRSEGQQLMQMTARAAQWDEVLQLWDLLASRCKKDERPATTDERLILKAALDIHNRIWQGRQAQLQSVEGDRFNFEVHERVGLKGDHISAECLPGLINAAGKLQKKCLVKTN